MSEIEKMQHYIERTKTRGADNYSMVFGEVSALANMTAAKQVMDRARVRAAARKSAASFSGYA